MNAVRYETTNSLFVKDHFDFTVFTPTFNRAKFLPTLYESLRSQTYTDFEWLVVDGGNDETQSLVQAWGLEAGFPIRYIRQQTTGLHGAYNEGALLARGGWFLTIHSDDSCLPETLERFKLSWERLSVEDRSQYSGIWARCLDQSGKMIGRSMGVDWLKSSYHEMMFKHGRIREEMFPLVRTEVMREFPFPMVESARFVPEGLIWSAVGMKYKTVFIDAPLRVYAVLDENADSTDKLTNPAVLRANLPALLLYYRTTLLRDVYWAKFAPLQFLRIAAAYGYYSLLAKVSSREQLAGLSFAARVLWCVALPIAATRYVFIQLGGKW